MSWFQQLITEESVAQAVIVYGLVIALGVWIGRLKFFGISLGVTYVLFIGLAFSYFGIHIDTDIEHFMKEFGLILFVYTVGLQVGPGFFASLRKSAVVNNSLAAGIVVMGIAVTLCFYFLSDHSILSLTGLMSGAVTNTPGMGAAQAAANDMRLPSSQTSMITLAYAIAYPFGVFGIIGAILMLKRILRIKIKDQRELHRKLDVLRSNKPVSLHLLVENKQIFGKHLRDIFDLLKQPIVISRMKHQDTIFTPTPQTQLAEGDVLLVVAHKEQVQVLKMIIGGETDINLREEKKSELISRTITVTQPEVTHTRIGDIAALHQHDFTISRLTRARTEMVPHGDILLQLGDNLKVVGTKDGVNLVTKTVGNELKRLEVPDLAPLFIGIVLGAILGSIPVYVMSMPVPLKIGLAGGPLIIALILSRYGNKLYINQYTTFSANLMLRELGISLFLASVGLSSGSYLHEAFGDGRVLTWIGMALAITVIPLLMGGLVAHFVFKKTYFEVCGLLAGASTDPPALAFSNTLAKSDVAAITYATVYPLTMILRIIAGQLLILLLA